ncbi:Interleukin-17F [Pelobates cultripes]|uniref:Interleukin-17F, partial n=1 Tax=Pelobates cultripes TaxID=61616 RepID=A0AAD1RBL9_PELCU|nr:Interleukin-17F [Pelobates cultripes]
MKFDLQVNSCTHSPSYANEAHTRSLSPWEYSMNEDKNRFPAIIAEATCTHNRCVDSTGNLDSSASSVPISQEILVLRRPEGDPKMGIMLDKQLITVGCTCMKSSYAGAVRQKLLPTELEEAMQTWMEKQGRRNDTGLNMK